MMKKKQKKLRTGSKWKQQKTSIRGKSGKSRHFSGSVRYIISVCTALVIVRFIGIPVSAHIKAHPVFSVRKVAVEGAHYLDTDKILKKVPLESGKNIFDVDLVKIAETLKASFTSEDFTVCRRLPDTIAIKVRERKPVALLNMKSLVGVDTEGITIPYVGEASIGTLPIITGIESVASLSDSTVKTRLVTGLRLLERISEDSPSVYSRISEIDVSSLSKMGITLIDNGLEIIIGAHDWSQNIPNLERVVNEVTEHVESVKAVDIRFGNKIFIRK